jgi:hypothetical protein
VDEVIADGVSKLDEEGKVSGKIGCSGYNLPFDVTLKQSVLWSVIVDRLVRCIGISSSW